MTEPTLVSLFVWPLNQLVTGLHPRAAARFAGAWAFAHAVVRRIDDDDVSLAPIERWVTRLDLVGEWQRAQAFA